MFDRKRSYFFVRNKKKTWFSVLFLHWIGDNSMSDIHTHSISIFRSVCPIHGLKGMEEKTSSLSQIKFILFFFFYFAHHICMQKSQRIENFKWIESERERQREREHESVDGTKESKAKRNAAKDMKAIEIIVRNFSALVLFSSLCIRFECDFRFYSVLKRNDLIFVYFFASLSLPLCMCIV